MTLRDRIIRAGTWTVASYAAEIIAKFFSSLIMTRLLVPDAFGLVAAAMTLIVGLQLVSDFGVRAVIVRSPRGEEQQFLRSTWSFQATRGTMLWIVLCAGCALLLIPSVRLSLPQGSIYASPLFPPVAIALGCVIVLGGVESATISLNIRRLNFRPIFTIDLISKFIPIPAMILWAYLSPSVWAIVGGTLLGSLLRTILSHIVVPGPRMSFSYERDHIREIVSFGKWINLSSFATFIGLQSDFLILGFLIPGPMLGLYYIARTLKDSAENLLERLNSMMTLSVLGEVARREPASVSDRYYQFRLPIELAAALSGGFLFTASDSIIHFLYDPRYHDAGSMLRALSLSLVLYPFLLIRGAFAAVDEAHVTAWISVTQAASLVVGMIVGYWWAGPIGAIFGGVLSKIIPSVAILVLAHRKRWTVISKECRWLPAYLIGLVMGQCATYAIGTLTLLDLRRLLWS
ncbi:oligosaccharide flippase family protein [Bradyrhizobium manausense]|uniref:oligosaccharide flippase family protein n=1 Tax=Bradyrhizobium manausense TaxID=989370 RepID=UPI001BA51114|nr:oligosaccharide flippase family protein [Bradyrhizobium manausense]MBR0725042.1 oligosaccharide flippase family protein [Bradyrhizobium manausense]